MRWGRGVRLAVCGAMVALGLAGCGDGRDGVSAGTTCTRLLAPHALVVSVTDSVSGAPLAIGTAGTADASAVHDTLLLYSPGDSLRLHSSRNTEGRYRITLNRPGYQTWIAYGVNVVWGACDGGNVQVSAKLQRTTP